jgi:hypothetical protein
VEDLNSRVVFTPSYVQYGDLPHPSPDYDVRTRWAELANEQIRSQVNGLLGEINFSIHALVKTSNLEYGQQLSSSGEITRLFEQMEECGMTAEMPVLSWNEDGRRVRIGQVEGIMYTMDD